MALTTAARATAPALQPVTEPEKAAVIVTAVVRAAEAWRLTDQEAADLFDVPVATWTLMKSNTFRGRLDQDNLTRASLIIGMFKGLRILFSSPLNRSWPKMANNGPGFNGRSPVQVMIEGDVPTMVAVRRHIDALRGGA